MADDQTEPAAGMARLRVSHQIPNTTPLPVYVCYDPGLVPTDAMGGCTDTTPPPAGTDEESLFGPVEYGTTTDYVERDPIEPTIPSMGAGGGIYLVAQIPPRDGCVAFSALTAGEQRCLPILDAFPTPQPSDNIQPSLEAGDITTLFLNGVLSRPDDPPQPQAGFPPAFFLWQDNYVAP